MIKNVLQDIGGIGLYGVVSICIFFLFFTITLIWASRLNKGFLNSMSTLPLDKEPNDATNSHSK